MGRTYDQIQQLSSAEDFFQFFEVPYDRHVLDVCRLHIMKRMGQYLADDALEEADDAAVFATLQGVLARAYDDFTRSTPAEEKVFKVFHAQEARAAAAFVGFDALAGSLPTRSSQTRQGVEANPAPAAAGSSGDKGNPLKSHGPAVWHGDC